VTVPALVVLIPTEGHPSVFLDARSEREKLRLLDWLATSASLREARAELSELIDWLGAEEEQAW
jgi:hypothetical protein